MESIKTGLPEGHLKGFMEEGFAPSDSLIGIYFETYHLRRDLDIMGDRHTEFMKGLQVHFGDWVTRGQAKQISYKLLYLNMKSPTTEAWLKSDAEYKKEVSL